MEKVSKILLIMPALKKAGGIENIFMNYYSRFQGEFKFDFVVHECDNDDFVNMIQQKGDKLYILPKIGLSSLWEVNKQIEKLFKINDYDIVHCHMANGAYFYFRKAKKYGVKCRILHGHLTKYADIRSHEIRNFFLVNLAKKYTTNYMACGKEAGEFLTKKKKVYILNNAISLEKYAFDFQCREEIRNKYDIAEDVILLGHVGRLVPVKNQKFLLDLIKRLCDEKKNIKLMIIGDGPLREELYNYGLMLGLEGRVIFVDSTRETSKYYQAFDYFLLPSYSEGVPTVLVEAQSSNLPCIISDKITNEVIINSNVVSCQIDDVNPWVSAIESGFDLDERCKEPCILKSNFNIEYEYKKLLYYYENCIKG